MAAPSEADTAALLAARCGEEPAARRAWWRVSPRAQLCVAVGLACGCACAAALALGARPAALRAGAAPSATGLAEAAGRRGSFLVIGDWGWDPAAHGNVKSVQCQRAIADKMLATMRSLGDVKFIINVGDSFYPNGVSGKGDPQWDTKWRQIFHKELRSVPWYSVYGNHDLHKDPCACGNGPSQCAQVNGDVNNLDFFYMPSYNWFREHPELGLEVVGLDLNQFMWAWNTKAPFDKQCATDCFWTRCHAQCEGNMIYRAKEGLELLHKRFQKSSAKNLVVFSHYPTDYLWKLPGVMAGLRNASRRHVAYFGGHRHNVDQASTASTHPNTNWLVGGGGGWSCDPVKGEEPKQGFVVGEIGADFELTTRPVLVDPKVCCAPPPPPGPPPPPPPPGTPVPFCAVDTWVPNGL